MFQYIRHFVSNVAARRAVVCALICSISTPAFCWEDSDGLSPHQHRTQSSTRTSRRRTRQRAILTQVLRESTGPIGAQDVHAAAQKHLPTLGLATVYRALKDLTETGLLTAIRTPEGITLFEMKKQTVGSETAASEAVAS